MAPFSKPETVLKQAEGLVSVGQAPAALQSLSEILGSKRFRATPIANLEPIMNFFLELCVDMRRGRTAKEGLMQYKTIAQNSSVGSVEEVVKHFLALSDGKVQAAQAQAEKVTALDVDDLEASETPEDVLLGAVSGDQTRDRTDRALVTPWLKFAWESYRTALETLKNNARLEKIYQSVASMAFSFCLKYGRKVEFRRLCETLRLHLATVAKYANQPNQTHAINLSDPDTLQRYLDTRFAQLNTSVELELWQEAFRSVEDIHNLLTLAKRPPRPAMMANYYEQLAKIFLTSGNALYHAAAWNKYYTIVRAMGTKSEDELAQLGGLVLISALAIPIAADWDDDENRNRSSKLAGLVGYSKAPSRAKLLREALLRNVLAVSRSEIQSLYHILEVDLHPLTICSEIAPIFKILAVDSLYAPYLPHLHQVLLSRLLGQLSSVYADVKLDYIHELVQPLNDEETSAHTWDTAKIEAFVVASARRGEINIRIDHGAGTMTFVADVFGDSSNVATTSSSTTPASPAEVLRTRFSHLAGVVHSSLAIISPPPALAEDEVAAQYASLIKAAETERSRLLIRRAFVLRRSELVTELSARKEKEETNRRAEAAKKQLEEDTKRVAETNRRRELDRIQREVENQRKQEVQELAKALMAKTNLKIEQEDLENIDADQLRQRQVLQHDQEQKVMTERLRVLHKRIDHLERASRKEEKPLLEEDYKRQQTDDKIAYEKNSENLRILARQKHDEDLKTKARLARMTDDYNERRKAILGKREEAFQKLKAEAQAKIAVEKAKRREQVLAKRAAEREAREAEEARQREREAEEARIAAELEAEEEKQRAEAAAAEAKKAEEKAKLEEARKKRELERQQDLEKIEKQRKREEEAEANSKARLERAVPDRTPAMSPRPSAAGGPPARNPESSWRTREALRAASGAASPSSPASNLGRSSSGAYVPLSQRGTATPTPSAFSRDSTRPSVDRAPAPSSRPSPFGDAKPVARSDPFGGASPRPSTRPPAPTTNGTSEAKPDGDGFQTVAPTAKWRPKARTGPGEAPPR